MRLGIDGANLRSGGSFTHLYELLRHAEPRRQGFERVIVWGYAELLSRLPDNLPWLERVHVAALDRSLSARRRWQRRELPRLAAAECEVLFAPGGSCGSGFRPVVTMSRNLLPFMPCEMARYGRLSREFFVNLARRRAQIQSYRTADAVIFLNEFARQVVAKSTGRLSAPTAVIPHGVDAAFRRPPVPPRNLAECTRARPFRLLYVSTIDVFKHPWNVAEAVARLRGEGFPVTIDFIGTHYSPALRRFAGALRRFDPRGEFLHYRGKVRYHRLPGYYHAADGFVFASSCENQPNSLVEAMAAGLPIACAARRPMTDILGPCGVYFDPCEPGDIFAALKRFVADPALRRRAAESAYERSQTYCWRRTANETFALLAQVAIQGQRGLNPSWAA